jgi:hypothetical protein
MKENNFVVTGIILRVFFINQFRKLRRNKNKKREVLGVTTAKQKLKRNHEQRNKTSTRSEEGTLNRNEN